MNSFGICFLSAVVTRCKVKSSIRRMTHALINFDRFSNTFLLIGDEAIVGPVAVVVVEELGVDAPVVVIVGEFIPPPVLSRGACPVVLFGW